MSNFENPFIAISDRELPALTRACFDGNDGDPAETMKDLEVIDRSLHFMKSRILLTRKSPKLSQQIDALVTARATGARPCWNARLKRYEFINQ